MKFKLFFLLVLISAGFIGCKEDDPTKLQVYVVDEEGNRVQNAVIQFNCESSYDPPRPCDVEMEVTADGTGYYEREFDQPSVLRINAFKIDRDTQVLGTLPDTSVVITADSLCGESYVSIQEFETTKKTVVVYECN